MSIQVYECQDDGRTEVFLRGLDIPQTHPCPECGEPIPHVISAPALVDIRQTWNDKANYCRVSPYEQAKAQLNNLDREDQEHNDARPMKITEEAIQATARQIDDQKRTPPRSAPRQTQRRQIANARKKTQQT